MHDSQLDLSARSSTGTGYFCVPTKGYSTTMQRGTRAGPISLRKAKERADIKEAIPIERVFAMLKRSFRAAHHDHDPT